MMDTGTLSLFLLAALALRLLLLDRPSKGV